MFSTAVKLAKQKQVIIRSEGSRRVALQCILFGSASRRDCNFSGHSLKGKLSSSWHQGVEFHGLQTLERFSKCLVHPLTRGGFIEARDLFRLHHRLPTRTPMMTPVVHKLSSAEGWLSHVELWMEENVDAEDAVAVLSFHL